MKIGITGASGLIGTALQPALRDEGHQVIRFVRQPASAPDERRWDARHLAPEAVEDLDAVIHLAGAGVGDHRWTDSYRQEVLTSRTEGTRAIALAVAQAGVPTLLSASAVGYYGDTEDRLTDETGGPGSGFLADVCVQWEAATAPADTTARVVHLRTGIVLAKEGGALAKQLPIFKAFLGAPLGSGKQWLPWIGLRDEVRAIVALLTTDVSGPVNLVAPNPVTNAQFTKALGRAVHRPTLPIPVPGFVLHTILGEFADEGVLAGQRLTPAVLQGAGFTFDHPDVDQALQAILG